MAWLIATQIQGQEVGIPYRKGNLWGLSDTSAKIILEPIYDSLSFPKRTKTSDKSYGLSYFCKKNGKIGFIYNNRETIKPEYQKLMMSSNEFIRVQVGEIWNGSHNYKTKLYKFFTFEGVELYPKPISRVFQLYSFYYPRPEKVKIYGMRLESGNYQLVSINNNRRDIQLIGPECEDYNYNSGRGRQIVQFIMSKDQKFSYEITYNTAADSFDLTKWSSQIEPDIEEDYAIEETEAEEIYAEAPIEGNSTYGFKRKNPIAEVASFRINSKKRLEQIYYLTRSKYKDPRTDIKSPIHVINSYKLKSKDVQLRSYKGKDEDLNRVKFYSKNEALQYIDNYVVYEKNGLLGIINHKIKTEPLYHSVVGYGNLYSTNPLYIVSTKIEDKVEYSVVAYNGFISTSRKYDLILPMYVNYSSSIRGFKVKKGNKWNIINEFGVEQLPSDVDEVISSKKNFFTLKGNEQYGYFTFSKHSYRPSYISPTLPYPIRRFSYFNKHYYLMLENEYEVFKGYATMDGRLFFED